MDLNKLSEEIAKAIVDNIVTLVKERLEVELKAIKASVSPSILVEADPPRSEQVVGVKLPVELPSDALNAEANVTEAPSTEAPIELSKEDFFKSYTRATAEDLKCLEVLPIAYKEAILGLSVHELNGVYCTLKIFEESTWLSLVDGSADIGVCLEEIWAGSMDQYESKKDTRMLSYLEYVFGKITKLAKKKQRDYDVREANLKKLEESKKKKALAAQKRQEELAAIEAKKKALLNKEPVSTKFVDVYAPTIPKPDRKKVGIIGVKGDCKTTLSSEFGNTFLLNIVESRDGMAKQRAAGATADRVYVMKDFISHETQDNMPKDRMVIVKGAMTSIREHLSKYATEVYGRA